MTTAGDVPAAERIAVPGPEFTARASPEHLPVLEALAQVVPTGFRAMAAAERRAVMAALSGPTAAVPPGVTTEDREVPGLDDDVHVPVRVYRPTAAVGERLPAVVFLHGGGMWMGGLENEHAVATWLCEQVGAVVVSVAYRLAPEHPYPAAPDDCTAALRWLVADADELGVDPGRVALWGGSAGGGLALSTALRARDEGGPALAFVLAASPMLDDRTATPSAREFDDLGGAVWDGRYNREAWAWYTSGLPAGTPPPPYAAPARATDLTGLPPTFIDVGVLDAFRDEALHLAGRLAGAGVEVEAHLHPGAFHDCDNLLPTAPLSRRIRETRLEALRRALHAADAPG